MERLQSHLNALVVCVWVLVSKAAGKLAEAKISILACIQLFCFLSWPMLLWNSCMFSSPSFLISSSLHLRSYCLSVAIIFLQWQVLPQTALQTFLFSNAYNFPTLVLWEPDPLHRSQTSNMHSCQKFQVQLYLHSHFVGSDQFISSHINVFKISPVLNA